MTEQSKNTITAIGLVIALTAIIVLAALLTGAGCGPLVEGADHIGDANKMVTEPMDVTALAAVVARLETDVAGIKAGRDSFAGLTFQSAAPFSLMPLLAFQAWLSHRREMLRIKAGRV